MLMSELAVAKNSKLEKIASQTLSAISCKSQNFELQFFDQLKDYIIINNEIPLADELTKIFDAKLKQMRMSHPEISERELTEISYGLNALIQILLKDEPLNENAQSPHEILYLLSAIDVGDRSTESRAQAQEKVIHQFNKIKNATKNIKSDCINVELSQSVEENINLSASAGFDYHKNKAISAGIPLAVLGAKWAFATAYQSCQNLMLPSMTIQTPNLQGVEITGLHNDGVGSKREIVALAEVQASHYYLSSVSDYEKGCFQVKEKPLIYDYGGKPFVTTATYSPINFFKNNGSGTKVLGIDCSGYVFSAMASAGLKLKADRPLKAVDALAWGSSSYLEPQRNGLTCLDKITITPNSSIRSGDIAAVKGHMLIIEKVGADPFGIKSFKTEKDCDKVTSESFDFIVNQSSTSKNAIGINRYEARAYLAESLIMKEGFEKYAYQACLASVSGKTLKPNLGTISIVRHNGKSKCMARRVSLTNESCIEKCSILD